MYCSRCRKDLPGKKGRCPDCGEDLVPFARVTLTLTQEEAGAGCRRSIPFPGMYRPVTVSLIPGLRSGQKLCVRNARFASGDLYTVGTLEIVLAVEGDEPVPEKKKNTRKKKKRRGGGFWAHAAACLSVLPVTVLMTLLLYYFTARTVFEAAGRSELLIIGALSLGLLVLLRMTVRKQTDTPRRNSLILTVSLTLALLFRFAPPVFGVDLSVAAGKLRTSVYAALDLDPKPPAPATPAPAPVSSPAAEAPVLTVSATPAPAPATAEPMVGTSSVIPHFEHRYFLNRLSPEELDNFTALYKCIASFSPVCVFPHQLSSDSADMLTTLILTECPELMQVDFTSGYYTLSLFNDKIRSMDIPYAMGQSEYRTKYAACAAFIGSAAAQMADMDIYEKEQYVYDLLVSSCDYSVEAPDAANPYGALIAGHAKCDGISLAAKWLFEEAGVTAAVLTGKEPAASVGHAWNAVLIDGVFCHFDITNDIGNDGACLYPAFNVPEHCLTDIYPEDAVFASRFPLPSVQGYQLSYHYRNGCFISASGSADRLLTKKGRALYERGGGTFTLQFEKEADYRAFLGGLDKALSALYSKTLNAGGRYSYNMLDNFRTVRITMNFS